MPKDLQLTSSHEINVDMSALRQHDASKEQERKLIANSLRFAYAWCVQNFTTLAPCAIYDMKGA